VQKDFCNNIGTKRTIAALQQFVRYWTRADIDQPLLELVSRSFDLLVDDLSRFVEGFGGHCERHRCGQNTMSDKLSTTANLLTTCVQKSKR
jgi:hypothetical protein